MASYLENLKRHLIKEVAPSAQIIDEDPSALSDTYRKLGQHRLMPLQQIPVEEHFALLSLIARYSGALAFLLAQQLTSSRMIAAHDANHPLLEKAACGDDGAGISHNTLRYPKHLCPSGELKGDTYLVSGQLPWVTGYRIYQHVLMAFLDQEDNECYALIPFAESAEILSISTPVKTPGMASVNTVKITLNNYPIAKHALIKINPPGTFKSKTQQSTSVLAAIHGTGLALLDYFAAELPEDAIIAPLKNRLALLESSIDQNLNIQAIRANLQIYLQLIIQHGITQTGGKSLMPGHPLIRLQNQLSQLSVLGLNNILKEQFTVTVLPILEHIPS